MLPDGVNPLDALKKWRRWSIRAFSPRKPFFAGVKPDKPEWKAAGVGMKGEHLQRSGDGHLRSGDLEQKTDALPDRIQRSSRDMCSI